MSGKIIPRSSSPWPTPGHWATRWLNDQGGRESAALSCPGCGAIKTLADHSINSFGVVAPSVECECGFHENVKLDDWY